MTHLDDLDDLDDDQPSASERRPRPARPVTAAAAITGVAAVLALAAGGIGSLAGNGGLDGSGRPRPVAFRAELSPARSCDDLLASYVRRGLRLVGPWGWQQPITPMTGARELAGTAARLQSAARTPGSSAAGVRTVRQNSSATGTNVQEDGVDEPDTVKTDGHVLAQVHDGELWLYDVRGAAVRRLSSLPLDGVDSPELLLSGDTVVVVGADADAAQDGQDGQEPRGTRVLTVDVSDPRRPRQTHDIGYDGGLLSARRHGSAVRLVLDAGLPDLPFVHPRKGLGVEDARKRNRALVQHSTIADWLPSVTTDGGSAKQLVDCTSVAVPADRIGLGTVAVVGFEATAPTSLDAIGLAGHTDIAYESTDHLYLAASPGGGCPSMCLRGTIDFKMPYGDVTSGGTSYVYDFAIAGDRAVHVASGEVEGSIRDRWSMDEVRGVLRVAVGRTSETGNFNSIVTLRRLGQDLVPLGRIDRLGIGEDIESVRWFDDLAIVTTYRQVDPLFAVDLSRPSRPRLLGRLRLPGFSSYLHPLGSRRLIGVGTGPAGNTQVGLFDTEHLRHLRRIDEVHFRGTDPIAATDPRAFTWVQQSRTALTVVERWGASRVGYLATLAVRRGQLISHLTTVEYGDDVDHVRAVPLGDGRVVLVTGEDSRFLEMPTR